MKYWLFISLIIGPLLHLKGQDYSRLQEFTQLLPETLVNFHKLGEPYFSMEGDSSGFVSQSFTDPTGNILTLICRDYTQRSADLDNLRQKFNRFHGTKQINFATLDAYEGILFIDHGVVQGEIVLAEKMYLHLSFEGVLSESLEPLREIVRELPLYEMAEKI